VTVRVVIVPTGGGQTLTGARATVELRDRSGPTVAPDPYTLSYATAKGHSTGASAIGAVTTTATVAPHTSVEVGDMLLMVAQIAVDSSYTPTVGPTWTKPSGVTELHEWPSVLRTAGYRAQAGVFWKWADADDAAGTSSYSTTLAATQPTGSGIVVWATLCVIPIRGLAGSGVPFGTVSSAQALRTATNPLATSAPSSARSTLIVSAAVRNESTTGTGSAYEQTYPSGWDAGPFWASAAYGGTGYLSTTLAERRAGHNRVATADGAVAGQVTFGVDYTTGFLLTVPLV
jgi:hypothetical protein